MTKQRAPLTFENALFRVLGTIGMERAAEITGRSADYLRSTSDPDTRYRLTLEDAAILDREFRAQGGVGLPIYETYGLLVDAANATRFADADALARRLPNLIRECGEANAAIVIAAQPGATPADRRAAVRETEDAIGELTRALPLLAAVPEHIGFDPGFDPAAVPSFARDEASTGSQAVPPPSVLAAVAGERPARGPP